jgi:hypothetical protein
VTDVLFGLQKEFPGFRIWQESHGDRKRYVACRVLASTRPHSVVTADPDELRDALSGQPGPGNGPAGADEPVIPAAPGLQPPGR